MRLRVLVPVGLVAFAALVPGCSSQCLLATTCPTIEAKYELVVSCAAQPLDKMRFELCRGDACESSPFVAKRTTPTTSDPGTIARCTTLPCRCVEGGAIESSVSGIGPMRARVLVVDPNGEERVLAERSGEVFWEEYELEQSCGGTKDCTHYAVR